MTTPARSLVVPEHILVCTGSMDVAIWLKTFMAHNHDALLEMGIFAVGKRDDHTISHVGDYDNAIGNDPAADARLLRSWANSHTAHTWILPIFQYYFEPKRFLETLVLCRASFPKAKITWVHGLTPVVPFYCLLDSLWCFRRCVHPLPGWLDRRLRFTVSRGNLLNTAIRQGKPGPDAIVMAQDDEPRSVVKQLMHIAGANMDNGSERNLIAFSPALCAPLARDTRAYVIALKNLFLRFGRPVFSWVGEEDVLQAGEDFSAVYSPEECERITHATKPDYERVAQLHNLPLLPDYAPDLNWQPFAELRREQVNHLMGLHSPDFGASIRDFLSVLEPRLLTAHERDTFADFLPKQGISVPASLLEEGETPRPKVSVLTPTYNHAAFIKDCIEGVLAQQTSFPIEHVIADDGSTDGTQAIILDYASRHPHIVPVMHPYHVGGDVNHRDLYQMARAPYVAMCDGDDYFTDPLKLQTQADMLDAKPSLGLCFHNTQVSYQASARADWLYPPKNMLPGGIRPRYSLEDLLHSNLMQTSSVMYRWRFGPVLPDWFILATLPSDWYLHLLHAEQGSIGFIDKTMSIYRRHEQAVYYTSEVNRLKHRRKYGLEELHTYDVVNRHFKGKYMTILHDLAGGVFADFIQDATKTNDESVLAEALRCYPEFADYALKRMGIQTPSDKRGQS